MTRNPNTLARKLGLRTTPAIFFSAAAASLLFVVLTIAFTDFVDTVFGAASDWLLTTLGWFYVLGVTFFLLFLVWVAVSRYGSVRLGNDDERPEYSTATWFAMLFAAGIGSILMFWGVAEPISHYANPPMQDVEPESTAAAQEALAFANYHFTLHTWTIFALPGLGFAYFIYKRKLPPRVSSIFQPLLGARIYGPIGKAIDITAVIGTVFGIAVSIGLGALQLNSGLNTLFGIDETGFVQVVLIAIVIGIAIVSVTLGLDKGIKRLSNINIVMAVSLLVFVIVTGSTLYLVRGTIEAAGNYLTRLPELAFWNDTFNDSGWQGTWTVFYWAWTITWSPFVGIFIARISRGRTIRQFVGGVLLLPAGFSLVWFSVFGLSAFRVETDGPGGLVERVVGEGDIPGALFGFLESFPWTTFMSAFAVLIIIIFFTTSADSAALVVDMMCNGDEEPAPTRQKVFWAIVMGAVAATMLAATGAGGLEALQQVITVIGLPFFVLGFLMIYSLVRGLRTDLGEPLVPVTKQWKQVRGPRSLIRQERIPGPPYYSEQPPLSDEDLDDDLDDLDGEEPTESHADDSGTGAVTPNGEVPATRDAGTEPER
ncbi:BCCT family transporter [Rhodococcus triatomae]|uniref:Choline/carnitine/betaine transport n=1 Tax=Rhodococcus triatomae TaxID=300028 RepID=A0A1G8DVU7_9NOCA|nr:BCCT family transporter [Rhodococcus triatomae]QNG18339.1 BCCT family transporter [Rhodococcus triatomae]QNG21991.1 BCCT family transporter [Rhodococcus triatomae]SDH61549.1 choline/carnitine/betaine transport [Rhodococcus triatomae]